MLVWRFSEPVRAINSGPLGGGLGDRNWLINATVDKAYVRRDPDRHLGALAQGQALVGPGAGMLTAVDVRDAVEAEDAGAAVVATVGIGHPSWAAAPDGDFRQVAPGDPSTGNLAGSILVELADQAGTNKPNSVTPPGTINLIAWVPVPHTDAAMVNLVITATEAKTQALWAHGVDASGTASDAIFIACPRPGPAAGAGPVEPFGGPRSRWGARLARAVYRAVHDGTQRWLEQPSPGRTSPL